MEHRHHANRKVARNAAADLKEPHGASLCLARAALGGQGFGIDLRLGALAHGLAHGSLQIPIGQRPHVLRAGTNDIKIKVANQTMPHEHVAQRGVFPAGYKKWQILLRRSYQPGVPRINLVMRLHALFVE